MFFVHVFHVHVGSGLLMIMVVHVQLFHVHGGSCSYFFMSMLVRFHVFDFMVVHV